MRLGVSVGLGSLDLAGRNGRMDCGDCYRGRFTDI